MNGDKSKKSVHRAIQEVLLRLVADTAVEAGIVAMTMKGQQGRGIPAAEVVVVVAKAADTVDATEETMVEIDVQAVVITNPTMTKDDRAGTVVMEAVTEDTTDELAPRNELLKVSKTPERSMVLTY